MTTDEIAGVKVSDEDFAHLVELYTRSVPMTLATGLWASMYKVPATGIVHGWWTFGTVLRPKNHEPPDRDIRVMALGNGTAVPLAGYIYTDYVPIPVNATEWEAMPEDES